MVSTGERLPRNARKRSPAYSDVSTAIVKRQIVIRTYPEVLMACSFAGACLRCDICSDSRFLHGYWSNTLIQEP
jgi:hypothetical protein